MDMKKMNVNWKCIWKICKCVWNAWSKLIDHIAALVTIIGIVAIWWQFKENNKLSKQEQANELIIEAVAIFNAANDTLDYQVALDKFLEAKKLKSNDITGYDLFLEIGKRRLDFVTQKNNEIPKYDKIAEKYLLYADSLNSKPNEAENLLIDLKRLKNNEK